MKIHRFKVRGRGAFPLDMLRYDCCWPNSNDSVELMDMRCGDSGYRELREISLSTTQSEPTTARWNSFGWMVVT